MLAYACPTLLPYASTDISYKEMMWWVFVSLIIWEYFTSDIIIAHPEAPHLLFSCSHSGTKTSKNHEAASIYRSILYGRSKGGSLRPSLQQPICTAIYGSLRAKSKFVVTCLLSTEYFFFHLSCSARDNSLPEGMVQSACPQA